MPTQRDLVQAEGSASSALQQALIQGEAVPTPPIRVVEAATRLRLAACAYGGNRFFFEPLRVAYHLETARLASVASMG